MSVFPNKRKWPRLINIAAAFCFLADRLLKTLALSYPEGWGRRGVAEFALFLNKGIAFSIGLPKPLFWLALGAAFLVIFLVYRQALQKKRWLSAACLDLVLVGAVSNLIDRVYYGATVDYLIFFGISAVNLADGAIVLGLIGWYLEMRGFGKPETPSSASSVASKN